MLHSQRSRKGFTLVELVIVVAVMAILAAVLIPTFSGVISKAKYAAEQANAKNLSLQLKTQALLDGVDYYSADEVQAHCKAWGKTLASEAKGVSFWYDRANNDIVALKDEEVFGAGAKAAVVPVASKFTQDCIEALYTERPSYLFVDCGDGVIATALRDINSLVFKAGVTRTQSASAAAAALQSTYDEIVDARVRAYLGVGSANTSPAYAQLLKYAPDRCLYADSEGLFTGKTIAPSMQFETVLFTGKPLSDGTVVKTVVGGANALAAVGNISLATERIVLPSKVTSIEAGAFSMLDPDTTIVLNTAIGNADYTKIFPPTASFTSPTVTKVTTYLDMDVVYHQSESRYIKDSMSLFERTDGSAEYASLGKPGESELGTVDGIAVKSQYLIPSFVIADGRFFGEEDEARTLADFEAITLTSKNRGTVVVMSGAAVFGSYTYRLKNIGYFTQISTRTVQSVGSVEMFYVSDPTCGIELANLTGLKIYAVLQDGTQHKELSRIYEAGANQGDYAVATGGNRVVEVYVTDADGTVIFRQAM